MTFQGLPEDVWKALRAVAGEKGFAEYTIESRPISALGENSYGLVLQTKIVPAQKSQRPFVCIVKIAPTNTARREHMLVADYYKREVFMYEHVFKAFRQLQEDERIPREHAFNSVPEIYYASLKDYNEFIIFEDLAQDEFAQNCRKNLPTFDLTLSALKALAKFHAMSFALQAKRPAVFEKLIAEIRFSDNLYTSNMNPVTVEFARKYVRRVKSMLANDTHRPNQAELLRVLGMFERHFKEIALRAVNGGECAPYSVICHGDFWNNNILYRYDDCGTPTIAKLIDFQMSRYASPVLDIVHYLFACTEKNLRDAHFAEFIESYYDTLAEHLQLFGLTAEKLFPRTILDAHLKEYGAYGFCMATFAIPFFICDSSDLPDLDEVSEAIMDLGAQTHTAPSAESVEENNNNDVSEVEKKSRDLVNDYELLNDSTLPVFRRRMTGVLVDLIKYDMVSALTQLSEELALTENACASNGRQ